MRLVVGQPLDGEVFAELAVLEVVTAEPPSPEFVGLALVDKHSANFAAMAVEIALPVAVDVQLADHLRPLDGILEDSRVDGPAVPGNVLRHSDIQ